MVMTLTKLVFSIFVWGLGILSAQVHIWPLVVVCVIILIAMNIKEKTWKSSHYEPQQTLSEFGVKFSDDDI